MLSVIIPAYCASEVIERCVNSVLKNTADMEVIVVDDGSTDDTQEVCLDLATRDNRIRYFYQENAGPGAARCYGLSQARGEWITFVDSDDSVLPGAYDILLDACKSVDVVEFGYQRLSEEGAVLDEICFQPTEWAGSACAEGFVKHRATNYLWNKLFRRELFQGVEFPKLYMGEDAVILAQIFVKAERYRTVPGAFYQYYLSSGSICRSDYSLRYLDDLKARIIIEEIYRKNAPEYWVFTRQEHCAKLARHYCMCRKSNLVNRKELCEQFQRQYLQLRKEIGIKNLLGIGSANRRGMLLLFEISPRLCAWIHGLGIVG